MHIQKTDDNTSISFFKEKIKEFINERRWSEFQTPKNLIQALQIEAAELSELFLFKDFSKEEILEDEKLYSDIRDEISDVFIYLISLINSIGLDLTQSFLVKMEKNSTKYPKELFKDGTYHKR
ncbi:MAG: putative Nucleotide pyrophosphohydrolase [Promethearchaeota archaeon]|nr:MAG: putative Nucleotide pyrophosphohydrolase [Candidatus Lokiarchaeota archaeon]